MLSLLLLFPKKDIIKKLSRKRPSPKIASIFIANDKANKVLKKQC